MTEIPYTDLGESVAVEQREFPTTLSRIAFAGTMHTGGGRRMARGAR